jgi:two-component system, chemotaxis family, CheB/CheR fusion protein
MRELIGALEAGSRAAYVAVTHHREGHTGLLSDLLSATTSLPVRDLEGETRLEPDVIYVAPAGRYLDMEGDLVRPREPPAGDAGHRPIDHFMRALAAACGPRAIGVVLSGTGTDGTLGLRELQAHGGMTLVQDPDTAQYSGMVDSAIAARATDHVLQPAEMPGEIAAYLAYVAGAHPTAEDASVRTEREIALLLRLVYERTGNDFSGYKRSTVERRVHRRIGLLHLDALSGYIEHTRDNPEELEILGQELLIGVTRFFRDPDAFEALAREALPQLLRSRPADQPVRVWVAGCATGEEAYSITILFRECMEALGESRPLQVFATDVDQQAIEQARTGVYPEPIAADVSPERLERFFVRQGSHYRIRRDIRESVVFAPHNVLRDAAFTRIDLVSCRNLLIYLQSHLQHEILALFHYALRPGGILFLGSSESVGGQSYFEAVGDTKHKIFVRRQNVTAGLPAVRFGRGGAPRARPSGAGRRQSLAEMTTRVLLEQLVPPSAVIDERGEVLHIHGRTGMFLEPAPGLQAHPNVIQMAREGLGPALSTTLRQAVADGAAEVVNRQVPVHLDTGVIYTDIHIRAIRKPEALSGFYLLSFENTAAAAEPTQALGPGEDRPAETDLDRLQRDLHREREGHQSVIEELEVSNEELGSTNEELQSANEELQSTNEELETSKEELQSLNEEMQTVNTELQEKISQLQHANDDMANLLSGTDIAILFMDRQLRVQRFTPRAQELLSVIATDVGRPISDLAPRIHYTGLVDDAREVLDSLVGKEVDVHGEDGCWYLMRILPYRTGDNVIDGLVVTLVDITTIRELQLGERQMREALVGSRTSVYNIGRDGRIRWVFGEILGAPGEQVRGRRLTDLAVPEVVTLYGRVLAGGAPALAEVTVAGERRYELYMVPSGEGEEATGVTCVQTAMMAQGD